MAERHPYLSGNAGLVQSVNQLRKSFPTDVTAETLKKLAIAPNNESQVISILRYIGLLDEKSKKTSVASTVFSASDPEFQTLFGELVKKAYKDLFDLHGEDAWKLTQDKLTSFFRGTDHTSLITGQRQASTFQTLAGLSGQTEIVLRTPSATPKAAGTKKPKAPTGNTAADLLKPTVGSAAKGGKDVGLTVRIEVNLPAAADQETYDRIFKSIRENLLDG